MGKHLLFPSTVHGGVGCGRASHEDMIFQTELRETFRPSSRLRIVGLFFLVPFTMKSLQNRSEGFGLQTDTDGEVAFRAVEDMKVFRGRQFAFEVGEHPQPVQSYMASFR